MHSESVWPAHAPRSRSGHLARTLGALVSTLATIACADGPTAPGSNPVDQMHLEPALATATSLGEVVQFTARLLDRNGTPIARVPLTWISSDPMVLESEGDGRFRARGNGTVTVSVGMAGNYRFPRHSAQVVVQQQAARIEFSADSIALYAIGQSVTVQARMFDALGSELVGIAAPSWLSPDPAVATVDGAGMVTARGDGVIFIALQAGQVARSIFTRVSSTVRVAGCVSSTDVAGETCSNVLLSLRAAP